MSVTCDDELFEIVNHRQKQVWEAYGKPFNF